MTLFNRVLKPGSQFFFIFTGLDLRHLYTDLENCVRWILKSISSYIVPKGWRILGINIVNYVKQIKVQKDTGYMYNIGTNSKGFGQCENI